MPRWYFIAIISLAAALLACGVFAYYGASRRTPDASFKGRSASYWLGEVFGGRGQQGQAIDAFRRMGTNAEPVLVAAIEARESRLARMYRNNYHRLPRIIRQSLPEREDPLVLRSAAGLVALNTGSVCLVPKLLPLLKTPDSALRQAVLSAVQRQVGPANAGQLPFVLSATNDPDEFVRMETAVAMWKINGQTNTSVPIVTRVLDQSQSARTRYWAACYLLQMGQDSPLLTTTFVRSLTNSNTGIRMSACSCLGQIGPPAAAAIPALHQALLDPDSEVRQRAKLALTRIDPEHPAGDAR